MKRNVYSENVGLLIRMARKSAGLSQMELADRVGISYQQIQKYEKGTSEINVSRLYQIAHALSIPLTNFIPDNEKMIISESIGAYGTLDDDEMKLIMFFRKLKNRRLKNSLLTAIKQIAEASEEKSTEKS
jgi:transcriptional regulator with XRE-family HTH domain